MQIGNVQSGSLKLDLQPSKNAKGLRFDYFDPRDGNQDGLVSVTEARAYALKHPEAALQQQLAAPAGGSSRNASPAQASPKTASSTYVDPADANQDGFVSVLEEQAYALRHPEVELLKRLRSPAGTTGQAYSAQGTVSGPGAGGTLDLLA
jgi:hypothetical protein